MLERLPDQVDVINRINAEHEVVLGSLEKAEEAVAAWRADPSSASRDAAAADLASLKTILLEHLDHEEVEVVPLIGQCITVDDWDTLSGTAFQHFSGDKVWLVVGLIQEQMLDRGERDDGGEHAATRARLLGRHGARDVPGLRRGAARLTQSVPAGPLTCRCPVPGWWAWWIVATT